ncbi:MAG TPA: chemotaxis protein CheB [Gemmataceae bacterium]|jgi:two-component system chemotaxis response regulator CheB
MAVFTEHSDGRPAPAFDLVALAASAGGLAVLRQLLGGLPADFPAAVVVAQHRSAAGPNCLPEILRRSARLPVMSAADGDVPRPGVVYVALPGRHLVVTAAGTFDTGRSAPGVLVRPSADLLFASVADRYGGRVVAAVLSGMGSDGARGVRAVRGAGGFVIAQDGATAAYPGMPQSAVDTGRVDLVLPLRRLAFALTALVMGGEAACARHPAPGPVGRGLRAAGTECG